MRKSTLALDRIARRITDDSAGGGSGDGTDDDAGAPDGGDGTDDDEDEDDDTDAKALGEPGKKALDRMKAKLREERTKRIAAEKKLTDGAKTTDTDVIAKLNARMVRSEIKAAAKGKLADPADAFRFIDSTTFAVGDDGEVDESAIATAIDELLREKPYLAAQSKQGPWGSADQGPRGGGKSADLSADEIVKKATAR